jgi:hypothetical protein
MGSGAGITELPSLGSGTAQSGSSGATLVTGRASDIQPFFKGHWVRITAADGTLRGTWRIDTIAARTVTLEHASGIVPGDKWQGLYRFDALTLRGGVVLQSKDPIETATQTISAPLTTSSITATNLHLAAGAVLTHPAGGSLTIDVAGELRIDAGAVIDATGLGHAHNDRYPGVPGADYADGGSHLGRGGDVVEGRTFGSISTPAEVGGGGYPGDVRGGGVIRIRAGSLVVNGAVRAPGAGIVGHDYGAGAGGSVWITTTKISGSGSISANGGDGCEAGGGGAIAIEYSDATSTLPTLAARAGNAQCGGRIGGPGTIRVSGPTSTYGDVIVDSMSSGIGTTELPSLGSGTAQAGSSGATLVTGRTSDIQPFFKGHWMRVTAADGTPRGTWRIASINARTVTLENASGIAQGDRWQGLYRFDDLALRGGVVLLSHDPIETATQTISAPVTTSLIDTGALRLTAGAVLTHPLRGSLQLRVANELRVDGGATIDATGLGYAHNDRYPGVPGADYADGGSHLGRGGDVVEGRTFGSVATPMEAGGGGYPGDVRGGGVIRIVAGTLVVNGEIRAPGANIAGQDNGAGAGGSVWITTTKISGSGSISANGGDGCEAGGGGAVAIDYSDATSTLPTLAARAGSAQCGGRIGGPGTIRVSGPSSTHGDVTIDSMSSGIGITELPSLGSGTAQTGSSGATLVTARTSDVQPFFKGHWVRVTAPDGNVRGTWRIASINTRTVTLEGASGITPGDRWQGLYRFDSLTLRGGATLQSSDPIETATQTISAPLTTSSIIANNLHLTSGAVLTHPVGRSLQIQVANELRVDAGALIDATALGYAHFDRYPGVLGADYADGGSHIGRGGDVAFDRTFGSIDRPAEGGGGGYPGDVRGGGVIRIRAASLVVNGTIRAPGANIAGHDLGAGAGGSVWITATKIGGNGTISANGGDGCEAGGGGAVALEYTDPTSTLPPTLARPGAAQCGGRIGGAGSVRVFGPASTYGDVTFDTGSNGYGITELPSLGRGTAQAGSGGNALVVHRDVPPYFVGHWIEIAAKGTWRIAAISGRTLTLDGASGIAQGDTWQGLYRFDTLTLRGVQVVSGDRIESRRQDVIDFARMNRVATGTLRVHPSSTLAHWDWETLDIAASTEVRVEGAIDVSALGYNADSRYPNTPGLDYADGGSHIGRGGDVVAGRTYGSVYRPAERGGGGYPGGAKGGGVVRITSPLVTVDGAIRANGAHVGGQDNGGGAGGAIRITATKLTGSGTIAVDGGDGCEAGGGGALSIEYSDAATILPTLTARAGLAGCAGRVGGAGSIYTFGPTSTYGALLADNTGRGAGTTELPSLGKGIAQAGTAGAALVVDRDVAPYFAGHWVEIAAKGTWRIASISARTLTLEGASGLAAGDAWEGIYRFDTLTKRETTVVSNDRIDITTPTPTSSSSTTAPLATTPRQPPTANRQPVDAPIASLTFLTLDPTRVLGGASVQAVVTLSGEAPLGGALVLLSANGPVAMPEAVLIPHGATTAVFTVRTAPVAEPVEITITATWGASRSATLKVDR